MYRIVTLGLATLIAVFVLSIPSLGTEDVAVALDWVFAILIPHYNLGLALMNVYVNYNYLKTCEDAGYQVSCNGTGASSNPCCCKYETIFWSYWTENGSSDLIEQKMALLILLNRKWLFWSYWLENGSSDLIEQKMVLLILLNRKWFLLKFRYLRGHNFCSLFLQSTFVDS